MPAPKSLIEKKEKLIAEEATINAQPSTEPVITNVTEPVAQPSAEAIEQPSAQDVQPVTTTVDTTAVALAAFEARLKAAEGVAKKAGEDLRDVRAENQRLQDKLQMQTDMIQVLSNVKAVQPEPDQKPIVSEPQVPTVDIPNVTSLDEKDKELLDAYDGLMPVFQKVFVTKEEFGQLMNLALAKLNDKFMKDIEPVRSKVNTIEKTEEQKRQERLISDINDYLRNGFPEGANIPDCVEINKSPEFDAWIRTMSDLSGNSYSDAYQNAVNKTFDARIIARIQREFLLNKGMNVMVQPSIQEPIQPVTPVITPPVVEGLPDALADQIALPRSSAVSEPKPVAVDTITEDEVISAGNTYARNRTPENKQKYEELLLRLQRKITAQPTAAVNK